MRIQKSIFIQIKFMQLKKTRILWTDDEIDSLHAQHHISGGKGI